MKKCLILAGMVLLLTGCGSEEVMETVSDDYLQPVMAQMQQVVVSLPEEAAVAVLEDASAGSIYLCDGYTVTLQTTQSGDLSKTLRAATGFAKEDLRLIQTKYDGLTRTEGVWTAIGENGDQLGRFAVLDDGSYHYVLTCMADAEKTEQLQPVMEDLFGSFRLVSAEIDLNTGS